MENRRSGRPRRKQVIRPAGVADAQVRIEPVGLDLICNSCGQKIPSSRRLKNLHFYYSPDGPQGSPLKRCFVRCPNCSDVLVLGQNIGDEDKLVVIADATEFFTAADADPDRDANLQTLTGDPTRDPHEGVIRIITEPGLRTRFYCQALPPGYLSRRS